MKTTRRTFLQLSGTATAVTVFNIVPSRLLGRSAPSGKIAMGMIGLGGMGFANLSSFLGMDDVAVKAVCDVSDRKRQAAKARVDAHHGSRDCRAFSDFRDLCARPDIDAVMIATPDYLHARVGLEALRCGKDVYGETPFARTHEEGLALADAVTRSARVWQAGNTQRAEPRFRRAVAAVRGGLIGDVARVEIGLPGGGRGPACGSASGGTPDFHWRWVSAFGGGPLADGIGLYGDTALWGAGRDEEPLAVEGCGEYPRDGLYDTATAFRFRCVYRDGMELTVADGGRLEKGIGVRWIGRDGRWVWVTNGALEASSPDLLAAVKMWALEPCAGLHRDFIACVKTRHAPLAPADSARLAAALGQAGDRAMRG